MNVDSDGFQAYRQRLYDTLPLRADALLDLLDSLSANVHAKSVAELSLEPLFKRKYSSLYDGIEHYLEEGEEDAHASTTLSTRSQRRQRERLYQEMLVELLPRPDKRPFWLLGIDTTGIERRFARTLSDRSVVYHPNPAPGNKPIGLGHSYSFLALLPERETWEAPWVVPLSSERVPTGKSAKEIAQGQVERLFDNAKLPFAKELTVEAMH
jgi:hypothetical protein